MFFGPLGVDVGPNSLQGRAADTADEIGSMPEQRARDGRGGETQTAAGRKVAQVKVCDPRNPRYNNARRLAVGEFMCFSVDAANGRVRFPKVGWLHYRASRPIEGRTITVTLRAEADGWYVSIACAFEPKALERGTKAFGIDRGVTNFAAFDSGQRIAPLDAHKRAVQRLCRYQWAEFLHKLSTQIARGHALVCPEDPRVHAMSASAAGTQEAPGKRVRQKAGLNRSILDQGWSMFKDQLAYKLEWRGGELVLVHPAYTSQRCHACAHTHADNRKGEVFRCRSCGHTDHADVNAAKNILAAGHAVLAGDGQALVEGQVQSDRPVKREPTEGLRRAA